MWCGKKDKTCHLEFKAGSLLSGNVWNRELTIIQHAKFLRLKNKKRSIKREIYPIDNINNYIQSQIDNVNHCNPITDYKKVTPFFIGTYLLQKYT